MVMRWLEAQWYRNGFASQALLPLAWLYCGAMQLRRRMYGLGVFPTVRVLAPVIIVGNITVGGAGKTPLVVWLAEFLKLHGYRPGIVTRGYGGRAREWPQEVGPDSDPYFVGDEPVLLARRTACPVIADPNRVRGAQRLAQVHHCNAIVSDDGLQHLRLARDVEIAVIDGRRRWGNGRCLPAGPLREPVSRLRTVDARVTHGEPLPGEWGMTLVSRGFQRVQDGREVTDAARFRDKPVHAVAGIGDPPRFFERLRALGLRIIEHVFPDHHPFRAEDICFNDGLAVIMTEKDAVKCRRFTHPDAWYFAVAAQPDPRLGQLVLKQLKECAGG